MSSVEERKVGSTEILTLALFPNCLCSRALPKFLEGLVTLRNKFPVVERILMSDADVSDAFRNVQVDPDQARNVRYTVGDLVVIDFRSTFG